MKNEPRSPQKIINQAMYDAVCDGDHRAVLDALERGADPNWRTVDAEYFQGLEPTPLFWAVYMGTEDIVDLLVAHGADVNGAPDEEPPLLEALKAYHPGIALLLVQAGADLTVKDAKGHTPLELARKEPSIFHEVIGAIKCRM